MCPTHTDVTIKPLIKSREAPTAFPSTDSLVQVYMELVDGFLTMEGYAVTFR